MKEMRTQLPRTTEEQRYFPAGDAVLDIKTSGRYWRTSKIEQIALIVTLPEESEQPFELLWEMEREEDEYQMLLELTKCLRDVSTIITFNGNSFDVPHLKKKYEAYGLEDPFHEKQYRDLYLEYKELAVLLGLPSRKLIDYADYLQLDPALDDACRTLKLLAFDSLKCFFDGGWSLDTAWRDETHLYYRLKLEASVPTRISFHDEIYHLILEGKSASLSIQLIDGRLRRYFTDIKNYVYLPLEGYAIHKSMAGYVAKEHKEKAVRANCFSVTSYSEQYLTDEKRIRAYLITALLFLQTR